MDKLVIHGGKALRGEVNISGAKNAALPIIAATLLAEKPVTLNNVPRLKDVETMVALLTQLGVKAHFNATNQLIVDASAVNQFTAPYELVKTMRASILVLGPLLARFGQADVSLPGGCAIGTRPVDLHLKALTAMGADINVQNGFIKARMKHARLQGKTLV